MYHICEGGRGWPMTICTTRPTASIVPCGGILHWQCLRRNTVMAYVLANRDIAACIGNSIKDSADSLKMQCSSRSCTPDSNDCCHQYGKEGKAAKVGCESVARQTSPAEGYAAQNCPQQQVAVQFCRCQDLTADMLILRQHIPGAQTSIPACIEC